MHMKQFEAEAKHQVLSGQAGLKMGLDLWHPDTDAGLHILSDLFHSWSPDVASRPAFEHVLLH